MSLFRSIRFKTLFAMSISVAFLFVVITLVTTKIISGGFAGIEAQKVRENVERVVDIYKFDLENLSTKMADWSAWDDSYKYIQDKNNAFKESNLVYATLVNLKINYMIFVSNEGSIVESIGIDDSTRGTLGDIPDDLRSQIYKNSDLITHADETSEKTGLLLLNEGPLMFASRPIVTSNGHGPIKGTIIFARYLDYQEIKNVSNLTHLSLFSARVDRSMSDDYVQAMSGLAKNNNIYIKPKTLSVTSGYTLLNDFFGKPALIFKVDYPRDITIQGFKSVTYFVYAFIITGLVFIFVLEFFLGRFLINRIEDISKEIVEIGENGYQGQRLVVGDERDEITLLTTRINEMLFRLSSSHKEVISERGKIDSFYDIVSGIVVVLSLGGKILSINKKGCEFLGVTEDGAVGRDWIEFIPEKDRDSVKNVLKEIVEFGEINKHAYFEQPVIDQNGTHVMFGWYNSVLRDGKGQIIATVCHGENVAKIGS